MELKTSQGKIALSFDDVLLVPRESVVLPKEADLKTRLTKKIPLNIPLVSAAMDTVTESKTAIAIARQGGIGIIHRNISADEQANEVRAVKRSESWVISQPITLSPNDTIATALETKKKKGISSFPVIENEKLVGIVTARDTWLESNTNKKISEIMTKKLITVDRAVSIEEAKQILHKERIEKLPIIDKNGKLKGLITVTDIKKSEQFPNALKDKKGRLLVGAAIGPADSERIKKLIEAEADVIVLDTAHGHSKMVVAAVKKFKKDFDIQLVAGNISTKEATANLIAAEADAVKVGQGPGTICTTRVIAGAGMPQFSAVLNCAAEAEKHAVPVIADGGIRYSGDITKAIVAGAGSVMLGNLFAGCEESPARVVYLKNRKFKQYRAMGSISAMQQGSKERYFQEGIETSKLVPEGVEGVVPFRGTIAEVVFQLLGGLRSGMGLVGAKNIEQLRKNSQWVRVTQAGIRESHPHDLKITEESPNYSVE